MKFLHYILALTIVAGCVGHPADDVEDEPVGPVTPPSEDVVSAGLIMDFTATWCVNCPRMASAIEEASREKPGQIYPVCVHFRDDFSTAETEQIAADFGIQAYPSLIVNLSKSTLITATSKDLILAKLESSTDGNKLPCDISASVENGTLTVNVTAKEEGTYQLGAMLLENGIVSDQKGADANYVHNHILRKILSASLAGEDLGLLGAGTSARKEFSYEVSSEGDFHILTYVTDGGIVNAVKKISLP